MSFVDVREAVRDSPARAFSLLTVRAAISSARDSDAPWPFTLFLIFSYWRARLVPFLTPAGGHGFLCERVHPLSRSERRRVHRFDQRREVLEDLLGADVVELRG